MRAQKDPLPHEAQRERWIFIGLAACTWVYVVLRAMFVPLLHDEAISFFEYARTGNFQPGYGHWDANNHLLNSAFGHLGYLLLGKSPAALRIGSVLCFPLYGWYVWRIGAWINKGAIGNLLRSAMLLMPFALDFFSLFRGYGPALAFGALGAYHLVRFASGGRWAHAYASLLGLLAAAFASLSMVLLAAEAMALIALLASIRREALPRRMLHAVALLLIGIPLLGYLRWYGQELQARDLLYYGSPDGLMGGMLASLCRLVLGSEAAWLQWGVVAVLGLCIAAAIGTASAHQKTQVMALRLLLLCLLGELCGRELLWRMNGVLYPIDRAALHLVPMYLVILALALDRVALRAPIAAYGAIVFVLLPVRAISGMNLERMLHWPAEALSEDLISAIEEKQRSSDRPLLLSAWYGFPPILLHARAYRHPELPVATPNGFPIEHADLLLLDTLHAVGPPGFTSVWQSPDGLIRLLGRDEALSLRLLSDSAFSFPLSDGPFIQLWNGPADADGSAYLLDVELRLRTKGAFPAVHLVSDAHDAEGRSILYDGLQLQHLHDEWHDDTLRIARHFPRLKADDWAALYLWVVNGRPVGGECRVRAYRIMG